MAWVQSVDDKSLFAFISDANAHPSERLESISLTDRHGLDALDFCNLSVVSSWCMVLLTLLVIDLIL